ncbi:pyridoxal phosphate-dependent aminotransferase [Paenibacillus sp. 1011MAR3C5]|nr:pyridoxal phosphate-dependent aminotransferase [Paenibacillus sp. 1011MAR3C5]
MRCPLSASANARIYLSPPHMSGQEQAFIGEAFMNNWIAPLGPHINAFESEISGYVGSGGAAAVSSGTAAIHLALRLLGVGEGDRVCCPSFTFIASANPIRYLGAEPVFIDSEPESWNMSPAALERALALGARFGQLPKAVIVVHLYGGMANMNAIMSICERYGVPIVEDAAESLGSTYEGRQSGTFGRFGIFSFNGNKIITTSGGGMLVSDDILALEKARFLATQARDEAPHYQHSQMGYNYRMSNVLAGIGRAQLGVLNDRVEARRNVYHIYEEALKPWEEIRFMPELPGTRSNRWLTALTIDSPHAEYIIQQIMAAMIRANIEVRPLWKPLHMQPLFSNSAFYSHSAAGTAVCEDLFLRGLCLPSGSSLALEDQGRVIDVVEDVMHQLTGLTAKAVN